MRKNGMRVLLRLKLNWFSGNGRWSDNNYNIL